MEKSHFVNMGVKELLHELLENDNVQFGEIDMYNHIRKSTNNFEIKCVQLLYVDLLWFIEDISMTYENETYPLYILSELNNYHPHDLLKFRNPKVIIRLKETINYAHWEGHNQNENKLSTYLELASILNANNYNLGLKLKYKIIHINEYVNMFNDILKQLKIDIEVMMKDDEWRLKLVREKNVPQPKQPLTFIGLFKDEYKGKIPMFYNRLIANGYIDKNHNWRETDIKNEPAKVYFWLVNNGVIKPLIKSTPALICFCKEFGITAYNDNEPTPPTEIRAVTIKNLLKVKKSISSDEKEYFQNVFLSFLIK
ncbi:MAG: hypothetical protein PHR83_05690 [Paludibacter sp.]|nr:hypothetical protein [Paludibacter sp.]